VPTPRTFSDVLAAQLRVDPGRPLVTFYDEGTGERVELSVTTYANWVAKVASLLADEHDLGRGDRLVVDLPPHWLGPVFLGAAWTVGLVVVAPDEPGHSGEPGPAAVVCGPGSLPAWEGYAARFPVLACALAPLGVRFAEGVPPGVHDVGIDVWAQPDAFAAWDPPGGDDVAHDLVGVPVTQADLWGPRGTADRVLTEANPVSATGLASFVEPLAGGGSLVLLTGAGRARVEAIAASELVTARFPAP